MSGLLFISFFATVVACFERTTLYYRKQLHCCDPLDIIKQKEIIKNMTYCYENPLN